MPRCLIDVRGTHSEWGVVTDLSSSALEAMRGDGVNVYILENTIPEVIVDMGLARLWCFLQDIWNFRNPMKI